MIFILQKKYEKYACRIFIVSIKEIIRTLQREWRGTMSKHLTVINREQCIGCFSCMFACSRTFHQAITTEKAALRVRIYSGAEGLFSIRTCKGCADPDCARACPTEALVPRAGGGVRLIEEKCIHCSKCVNACIIASLQWDREKKVPIPCRHCGICTKYCPNEVIGMIEE